MRQCAVCPLQCEPLPTLDIHFDEARFANRTSEKIVEGHTTVFEAYSFGDSSDTLVLFVRRLKMNLSGNVGDACLVYPHVGQTIQLQIRPQFRHDVDLRLK